MNPRRHLFTSESVSEGHPDKIADQISDAILDAFLAEEPEAKVACETFVADNLVVIAGEFKTVRKELFNEIQARAAEIARQVLRDIGYACDETPDLMPYPVWLAHRIVQRQAALRKSGAMPWLRPDAKSQVTVAYENGKVAGIENVILSTQIDRDLDPAWVAQEAAREIIDPLVPLALRTPTFKLWVNPAGPFEIGGPNGDTGLTGRKIIVDTYGGSCPHGGGAFSGKDPTKVDRSAAYMARYIAKNIVAAGYAKRCLVQLAYAIGVAEPVSLLIETYGTGTVPDEALEAMVRSTFKLTPRGIIDSLDLRRPIYRQTAAYGHFGRAESDFTWERIDQAEILAQLGK